VKILVDGKAAGTVSLYGKTAAARQLVWTYVFPTSATHTVSITNIGAKGRPGVNVDAFLTLS
jgi:hypothetical protein